MNHVYLYEDGTFMTRHARPVTDIQEAFVGAKASVAAKAGSVTATRNWKKLPKLVGRAVPVVIVSETDYADIQEDLDLLRALQAAGVDNWDGYSFAIEEMEG